MGFMKIGSFYNQTKKFRKNILWSTIWILGMLYTILIVEQNVSEYLSYPAFIAQRSEERGYLFPKIRICSNSMHSRIKLKEFYPEVNITMIQKLYGLNLKDDQFASDSRMKIWTQDSKVDAKFRDYLDPKTLEDFENPPENLNFDLKDFFRKTRPTYQFVNCRLEFIDCRRLWEIVQEIEHLEKSPMGYCLELNPFKVEAKTFKNVDMKRTTKKSWRTIAFEKRFCLKPRDNFRTLGFTVGFNRTDSTYGWNGYMNGLTVFYMHPNETYQREEHSYPLVPGLTPIIYVKNEELKFLGKPYTECNENSTYWISTCQLEELIDRIQSFCDCTPSYMAARKDSYLVQELRRFAYPYLGSPECSFNYHSSCVALLRNNYKKVDGRCLQPCKSTSIHQETMHYTKLNGHHLDYIHEKLKISREIELISTVIRIAEDAITIKEEKATTSLSSLFSGIGGAMGLVLGLSLFNIVEFSLKISRIGTNRLQMCIQMIQRRISICLPQLLHSRDRKKQRVASYRSPIKFQKIENLGNFTMDFDHPGPPPKVINELFATRI